MSEEKSVMIENLARQDEVYCIWLVLSSSYTLSLNTVSNQLFNVVTHYFSQLFPRRSGFEYLNAYVGKRPLVSVESDGFQ